MVSDIHKAAAKGDLPSVKYLLRKKEELKERKDHMKNTPLLCACRNGQYATAKFLIEEAHVDKNSKNVCGASALQLASLSHSLKLVQYLAEEQGFQDAINDHKENHNTALANAANAGNLEIVKYLVEHGADVNIKGSKGETALFQSARNGRMDVVEYLLSKGALSSIKNDDDLLPKDVGADALIRRLL